MALRFIAALLVSAPLLPAPEALQPWTKALRDRQPDDAFAAMYRIGDQRLVFVGAQHENRSQSRTFRLIGQAYSAVRFDIVVAEGFPTKWGENPAQIDAYVARGADKGDGFVEAGETVPTVEGARRQGAAVIGGEADDLEIKRAVLADGFSEADLLGFYVLRAIPQWMGEKRIDNAGDPRLKAVAERSLAANRNPLAIAANVLPDFEVLSAWYANTNGRPLDASFTTEAIGPLVDGDDVTNRISTAVARARDAYLHRLIVAELNRGRNVLVVFGGSHLMIHRPALDRVLGAPCYAGNNLARSTRACRRT